MKPRTRMTSREYFNESPLIDDALRRSLPDDLPATAPSRGNRQSAQHEQGRAAEQHRQSPAGPEVHGHAAHARSDHTPEEIHHDEQGVCPREIYARKLFAEKRDSLPAQPIQGTAP